MNLRKVNEKLISSPLNLGLLAISISVLIPQFANILDIADPRFQLSKLSGVEIFARGMGLALFISTPLMLLMIFIAKKVKSKLHPVGFWVVSVISFFVAISLLKNDNTVLFDFVMIPIYLSAAYGVIYFIACSIKTVSK